MSTNTQNLYKQTNKHKMSTNTQTSTNKQTNTKCPQTHKTSKNIKPSQTNKTATKTSNYHCSSVFSCRWWTSWKEERIPKTSSQDEQDEPQPVPWSSKKTEYLIICLLTTTPSGHAVVCWLWFHLLRDSEHCYLYWLFTENKQFFFNYTLLWF